MSIKRKTIALTSGHFNINHGGGQTPLWLVGKVTDSTEFTPGDLLVKAQVDELCEHKGWNVTITAKR